MGPRDDAHSRPSRGDHVSRRSAILGRGLQSDRPARDPDVRAEIRDGRSFRRNGCPSCVLRSRTVDTQTTWKDHSADTRLDRTRGFPRRNDNVDSGSLLPLSAGDPRPLLGKVGESILRGGRLLVCLRRELDGQVLSVVQALRTTLERCLLSLQDRLQPVSDRRVRVQLDDAVGHGEGLVATPRAHQVVGVGVQGIELVRLELQRAAKAAPRLFGPSRPLKQQAEVVVHA